MKVTSLVLYIRFMSGIVFALTLVITFAPQGEWLRNLLWIGSVCGMALSTAVTFYLRSLPAEHWVHQSRPMWFGFLFVAVALTFLVVMIG